MYLIAEKGPEGKVSGGIGLVWLIFAITWLVIIIKTHFRSIINGIKAIRKNKK